MTEVITFITGNYAEIITAILAVIGAGASVAALTPTPKDDAFFSKALGFVKKAADLIGMNIGHAKNAK